MSDLGNQYCSSEQTLSEKIRGKNRSTTMKPKRLVLTLALVALVGFSGGSLFANDCLDILPATACPNAATSLCADECFISNTLCRRWAIETTDIWDGFYCHPTSWGWTECEENPDLSQICTEGYGCLLGEVLCDYDEYYCIRNSSDYFFTSSHQGSTSGTQCYRTP